MAEPIAHADWDGVSTPTRQAHSPDSTLVGVSARGHIAFTLSGLGAGGAERVVSIIANAMVKRGWRVSIISFAQPATSSYYQFGSFPGKAHFPDHMVSGEDSRPE